MTKDLFSQHATIYAKYRPDYPHDLYEYISGFVEHKDHAWDCATGNGQAAKILAEYFKKVSASDISASQLENAVQKPNIIYFQSPAEHTPFADNSFDIITVAQAYHWLNWEAFHKEATRVGKNNSVIAIWTYNILISEEEEINKIIEHFYRHITGPYWDEARRYVEEGYATVPFNFEPLPSKTFSIYVNWTKEDFKGYLTTWSAFQMYIRKNGESPLPLIEKELDKVWEDNSAKSFHFPISLRAGRIRK